MRWLRSRVATAVLAATIAAVAAGGISAAAALDPPPPQIHACVSKLTGGLRVVSSPSHCLSLLEKPLSWNQQGLAGPPGADGMDGTDGTDGAEGVPGVPGVDGVDGVDGVSGYEIVQGEPIGLVPGGLGAGAAVCPTGKVAVGGGFHAVYTSVFAYVSIPATVGGDSAWVVQLHQTNTVTQESTTATPYAACVSAS